MICARGMPIGPCGVLDQLGWEVSANVSRLMAAADPENPQHPKNLAYIEERFLSKGHTGVLSGQGFYTYPDPAYLEPGFVPAIQ